MSRSKPYISFVATSRNDNHGGTLTRRMQIFINSLAAQCKRHNLPAELLLVEWNPPSDRKMLSEALKWPDRITPLHVRIITVPNQLHKKFKCSDDLLLFQMIAKNVGIRRARAPFVLATNIDILLNDHLMSFLAARKLEMGKLYRIDRFDAMADVPLEASLDDQLSYCQSHILRVGRREGTLPTNINGDPKMLENDIVSASSEIFVGRGWYLPQEGPQNKSYRYMRSGAEIAINSNQGEKTVICIDLEPASGVLNMPFCLSIQRQDGTEVARGIVFGRHLIHIELPLNSNQSELFRFVIPEGGHVDPNHAKQMDAKVYELGWSTKTNLEIPSNALLQNAFEFKNFLPEVKIPSRSFISRLFTPSPIGFDIMGYQDGIKLGANWNAFEIKASEYVRHADNLAEIIVANESFEHRELLLEVESASGIGYEPFELQILDDHGTLISAHQVRGNPKRQKRFNKNRDRVQQEFRRNADRTNSGGGLRPRIFRNRFRERIMAEVPLNRNTLNIFVLKISNCPAASSGKKIFRGYKVYKCTWADEKNKNDSSTRIEINANQESQKLQKLTMGGMIPNEKIREARKKLGPANVHMNTCGDFTLMAKEHWFQIKGYPELEMYSMHIDSLGCHAAVNAGLEEVVLEEPMRIYHIEHGAGSGWTPEGEEKLFGRMKEKGIPVIEFQQLVKWATEMREKGPIEFNNDDWGLAQYDLKETRIG